MKVNYENTNNGLLIISTTDWGKYAVKNFAVPCIDNSTGTFNGAQSPIFENLIESIEQYGSLFVMKNTQNININEVPRRYISKVINANLYFDYPSPEIFEGELVSTISPVFFERIFQKSEIKEISSGINLYLAKNQSICTMKEPKRTWIGNLGMYLDSKFK
jgi:hypothetical protein